ncbi:MAG: response regulator [Chloroflexota bacterium]
MSQRDILLVDDDADLLYLLHRILSQRTSYGLTATTLPLEAAHELAEHDYALLIADLKMPDLDGLQLLEQVQRTGRPTEVVLMTAFGSVEVSVEAMERGVYDYITKPFRTERILLTVRRAMRWQRLKAELAALERRLFACPYAEGLAAYRAEYARRALLAQAGDAARAARATGIDAAALLADGQTAPDSSHTIRSVTLEEER